MLPHMRLLRQNWRRRDLFRDVVVRQVVSVSFDAVDAQIVERLAVLAAAENTQARV